MYLIVLLVLRLTLQILSEVRTMDNDFQRKYDEILTSIYRFSIIVSLIWIISGLIKINENIIKMNQNNQVKVIDLRINPEFENTVLSK